MNNENKQNQTNKIDSFLGRGIIDELLALKEEMAGRIEETITLVEQNFDRRLENAILFLAGNGNDENLEDSIGFNGSDSRFGHSLAIHLQSETRLTLKQAHTALQMMQKYSKTQLEPNGYSLPRTWEEISHQYRERTITLDPYRGHMVLQRDEEHDTYIAIYFVEEGIIDEFLEPRAGIEDGESWYVWSSPSGYPYYGYPLLRSEGLLAAAQSIRDGDWYVDPDIEAAYYLWQEEQKAGIGSGRISASFSHSATPSTIDELLALEEEMAGRIEEIVARIEQNFDHRLENAILFLAGSGNDENLEDSIGFNGSSDSRFGHSLARHLQSGTRLTLKQAHTALQMMQKYTKTQLEPNGYSLPKTWEEISHQYREREIEFNPYRLHLGLYKDEGHDACIAIRYPVNVETAGIREGLEESAGIEDGESWYVWSDNWYSCYPFRRAEGLLPNDDDDCDWYVDPDIEAAYYLWQEKQKAGIGSGISVSFFRSANSSESSFNDTVDPIGDVPLEMVYVPQGEFLMGSPESELERWSDEGPQHRVTISAFYMGKYPVTQRQWRVVSLLDPVDIPLEHAPSQFVGDDLPVEQVSWDEAVEFCKRLSKHTGDNYRLPSEAEWEYACRATQDCTSTPFYFGETISTEQANYNGGTYGKGEKGVYRGKTTKVGSFPANAFGLHDMHGNVSEWCEDVWHNSYEGAPTDGSAWVKGGGEQGDRVLRGGYWGDHPWACRSARREYSGYGNGFRVVCSSPRALLSEVEGTQGSFSRSATSSESPSNDTVDPMGDTPLEMVKNVLRPGDYSGVWHGHAVKFSIQQIFPAGEFNGVGEFVVEPHNEIQFGFTGKIGSDGRLTISRDVGIGSQVARDANFEIDGDSIIWQGLTKGTGIGDAGLPFEFRAQSIGSGQISASFSRSATSAESSS